jgi:hypothetical protein
VRALYAHLLARLLQVGVYAIDIFVDALFGLLPFVAATALQVAFAFVDSSLGTLSLAEVIDVLGKIAGLLVFFVRITDDGASH